MSVLEQMVETTSWKVTQELIEGAEYVMNSMKRWNT